jgi:hypothetical protein
MKYYGIILLSKTLSTEKLNSLEYAMKEKIKSSEEVCFFNIIQDTPLSDISKEYILKWNSLSFYLQVWTKDFFPTYNFQRIDNFIILVDSFTKPNKCNKWIEQIKKINKKGVIIGLNKLKPSKDIFEF